MSRITGGYVRGKVYKAHPKRVWDITFRKDHNVIVTHCYLLRKLFNQDEAVGGKLSSKRVSLKSSELWDLKNLFIKSQ